MKKFNYIYLIRNLINNKIYIGKHSTDNYDDGYFGSGIYLKNAIKKYGKENFRKTLLCLCDEEDLNEMEKLYIQVYGSTNPNLGYNLTYGGDGLIPTDEVRRKLSESQKGRVLSEEHKSKISESLKGTNNPMYGKCHSDETKIKISESLKGKQQSEETKKKRSESLKGRTGYWYSKHHSEEYKQKMSESKKGKPKKKEKWLTPEGEIVLMDKSSAKHYHPDWILIEQ